MTTGSLVGRTAVVTGANTGIGRATAEALCARGARVVLAARSEARAAPVIAGLAARGLTDARFLALDLASLGQVAAAARELLAPEPRIDILVANAGVAGHQGTTADGFEIQFGVNHLGHYLFTRLLLERVIRCAPSRVVVVASENHTWVDRIDWDAVQRPTRTVIGLHEYSVSKLANVLFAKELARRTAGTGVEVFALNPGRVASEVWRRLPGPIAWLAKKTMLSNEEGSATTLLCATDPALAGASGAYFDRLRRVSSSRAADDPALARELWDRSEAWVAPHLTDGAPRERSR